TNYLHRPLFPHLLAALAADGVLIYETFEVGNERYGRPTNPDFLLKPGELLEVVRGRLRVIAYEDLHVTGAKPAMVQRICARRSRERLTVTRVVPGPASVTMQLRARRLGQRPYPATRLGVKCPWVPGFRPDSQGIFIK